MLRRGPHDCLVPGASFIRIIIVFTCVPTPLTQLVQGIPAPMNDPLDEGGASLATTPSLDNPTQPYSTQSSQNLSTSGTAAIPTEKLSRLRETDVLNATSASNTSKSDPHNPFVTSTGDVPTESPDSGSTVPPGVLATSWADVLESGIGEDLESESQTEHDGKGVEVTNDPRCLALCMINCTSNGVSKSCTHYGLFPSF